MHSITYSSGLVLKWDETITLGELITTYNDGYHILTGIDFENGQIGASYISEIVSSNPPGLTMAPIFKYTKVLKSDGTPSKKLNGHCSAIYCRRFSAVENKKQLEDEVRVAQQKHEAIQQFLP